MKNLTIIDTAEGLTDPQTDSVIELWSLNVDQRHIFTRDEPAHARSNIGPRWLIKGSVVVQTSLVAGEVNIFHGWNFFVRLMSF